MNIIKHALYFSLIGSILPATAFAGIALNEQKTLTAYGDARLRVESDFDGRNTTGQDTNDRTRARVRARLGLKYEPLDWLKFDARIRTGKNSGHQSGHLTIRDFDNHTADSFAANFDRYYAKAKYDNHWVWAGRNGLPFQEMSEIFWDSDVTILGVAGGTSHTFNDIGELSFTAGYFTLPVGMHNFSGTMTAAELFYSKKIEGVTLSLGESIFNMNADRSNGNSATLSDGNGLRDYQIWATNINAKWKMGDIPLKTGFEWLHNNENYSATDANTFTASNHDQTDSYTFTLKAGDIKKANNWLAAYYYTRTEALALNASYAQDEWARFDTSNIKGHQFNVGYAVTDQLNILSRLYLMESITTQERGNRFRVDFNYKF